MPRLNQRIPQLLRHVTGQARVKIGGHEVYLGKYGDPLTQEKYDRLIAEWLAAGRKLPTTHVANEPATISVVMLDYVRHIDTIHPTDHGKQIRDALGVLRKLYGSLAAVDFMPAHLEAVRAVWIEEELTRSTINRKVNFIRAMFKWATSRSLIPAYVWQALASVEGLRRGRSKAKESRKVGTVHQSLVDAVKDHVSPPVWALIQLQLLTAARSGELLRLRACDIDMSGDVWSAKLSSHKTAHHGHDRTLFIGPKAQEIIRPFLPPARAIDAYLFSPRESARWHNGRAAKVRRRPNQKPNPKKTSRTIGDCYDSNSYRIAITRGIEKAFPIPAEHQPVKGDTKAVREAKAAARVKWKADHYWHPHQLRHNAATAISKLEGEEKARPVLGHSSVNTTRIYAEQDLDAAREIIRKIG